MPIRLALLLLMVAVLSAAERRNVLFIICDDLNTDLGCYGKKIHSPAIDALALRGVRFTRAYCQYPLCNPSRSSLMTGLRPDRTRVWGNDDDVRRQVPGVITMPQAFRTAGYHVVRVGKFDHDSGVKRTKTGFRYDSWDSVIMPADQTRGLEPHIHSLIPGQSHRALSWLALDQRDETFTDGFAVDAAISQLQRLKDKPFFLALGFARPHTPYIAPLSWFNQYPLQDITLHEPRLARDNPVTVPRAALASEKSEHADMNDDQRRSAIQAYHACVSHIDTQVGRMLKTLDDLSLTDNTLIVFTSDHGYLLGEHGLWQKQSVFEHSVRVPLVIAGPGVSEIGKSCGRPAELVDLFPTLAELCGVPTPANLSGVSLAPLLKDITASGRTSAFSMVRDGRSLRSERWRYTEWDGGKAGVELYDHQKDPDERNNLAADPAHAMTVAEMKHLLAAERDR